MIFTRKYKVVTPRPLRLGGAEIAYATSVRYLGVQLDQKLHWKEYIKTELSKTYASLWACKKGRDCGFSPKISIWLYKMVLLQRLMSAAVVWWLTAERAEVRNRLKALQGNFLRAATGAMKTTPTDALEAVLDLPPLGLLLVGKAELTAYRLVCPGEWIPARAAYTELNSPAAIKALIKPSTNSKRIWETMEELKKLEKHNKTTLAWVPGHGGIHGNEKAGRLTKQGSLSETVAQPVGVPSVVGQKAIKNKIQREHTHRWKNIESCRKARAAMLGPSSTRAKQLLNMDKKDLSTVIRLLAGHGIFKAHCKTIGISEDALCRFCKVEPEDCLHIMCDCPALAVTRLQCWGIGFLTSDRISRRKASDFSRLAIKAGIEI
ncbi:uncharacterized protein [Fopius arisanus]|uniref:RNase H type-1 domain-containing protein n=1 Tax=Fopius arisanus TaxID=64838 RepID=A0A9R1U924_9HYME|nr:PREDICTED: uncharacterized protein LOC105271621 [Fopius arisanus]